MTSGEALCIPTTPSPAGFPQEGEDSACAGALGAGGTQLATEAMDGKHLRDAGRSPMASPGQTGPVIPGAGQDMAPKSPGPEPSCMALERQHLTSLGLEGGVVETLQALRAPSTQLQYKSKWRVFRDWCHAKNKDPLTFHISVILSFLQHLFVLGRAESTIRGYLAAVSTVHDKCEGFSPGAHPLASQFLRGVRWRHPPQKHLLPPWDLQVVLGALCLPTFEPLSSIDLRLLCWKTVFILAIASAKRVSELTTLSVGVACLRFGDRMVQLLPNPAFQPKVLPKNVVSKPLVLEAFHPPPHTSTEAEKLHNLCLVRALMF